MSATLLVLVSVFLGVIGQLVLKSGVLQIGELSLGSGRRLGAAFKILSNPWIWGGLGIYGISTLFWLAGLSRLELSYAYPFISLSYVLIIVAAWALLGEKISAVKLFGVACICLGVFIVAGGLG